ncbi:MAG TPA: TMEM175 family protein [Polyangia bacterium]|nr:TMEM175 family protein [Polyangia bacterium]
MSPHRVQALADGVFAIAMTVLVLGIQVPEGGGAADLRARLWALGPRLASYVLSFVMLGVLWIGHHYQFHYIRRTDRALLWLNLVFLLAITFLPFSTGVLGNYFREPLAVVLYGSTVVLAGICLLLHWIYASHDGRFVPPGLDSGLVRLLRLRIIVGLALSVIAIGLGAVDTRLSLVVFLAIPVVYFIRSRVDRHLTDLHPGGS